MKGEVSRSRSASNRMEKTFPYIYPDPTKPKIPPIHKKKSVGWILFIGFNILFPIVFLAVYFYTRGA